MTRSRSPKTLVETLEPRTLLSALITTAPVVTAPASTNLSPATSTTTAPPTAVPPVATSTGITLHLTQGVSFTGVVAFYPSPVLDPPDAYSATIDWGDGSTSQATLQYGVRNNVGGYEIIGTHAYDNAGNFRIVSTVTEAPIVTPGQPTPQWIRLVARIVSLAIVSPAGTGGVTIHELPAVQFTADVGSFDFPAPGTGLNATINWGDGTPPSQGTLVPSGVVGLDVIDYQVQGTHAYAEPGVYSITVLITKSGPGLTPTSAASPVYLLLTIDSTAIVGATAVTPVSSTAALSNF